MKAYKVQRRVSLRVEGLVALAEECGRSPQHISRVFGGKCAASISLRQILAEKTGVRFDERGFVVIGNPKH